MWKQAWKSYVASLHIRNWKSARRKVDIMDFIWLLWIWNPLKEMEPQVFFFMKMIPFIMIVWSNMVSKLSMPKVMFLTPMPKQERKEYIRKLLFFKIGVPVAVGVVLHLLYGICYELYVLGIIASALAQISFGIGIYVCSELRGKADRYIRYAVRNKDGVPKDAWLNWLCIVVSFILSLMLSFSSWDMTAGGWMFLLFSLGILAVIDIAIIKTRYHHTIQDVCDYENKFDVHGKVK